MPKGHIATYGLDPRVLQYLQRQATLEGNIAKEVNRENWRTNRQQLFGDMLGGIASGAAQIGTTFGKAPSVEGLQQQLAGQKATAEQYRRNAIKNLDEEREGLRGIDKRILDYLQPKQKSGLRVAEKWLPALSKDNKPVWISTATREEIPREGNKPPQKAGGRFLPTTGPDGGIAYRWAEPGEGLIPGPPAKKQLSPVKTIDAKGNEVTRFVEKAEGAEYPAPKAADKGGREANYRTSTMTASVKTIRDLVGKKGTFINPTSAEAAILKRNVYNVAIDYAKLIDPESVAREGEVATAQKYLLPVDELLGMKYSNQDALKIIDSFYQELNQRALARWQAFGGQGEPPSLPSLTPIQPEKEQAKPKEAPQQQYKPIPKTADGKIDAKALVVGEVYKMPNGSAVRWDGNKFMPLGGK